MVLLSTRTRATAVAAPQGSRCPLPARAVVTSSRRPLRLCPRAAAADRSGDYDPEDAGPSSWAADNISTGQMYHSNAYSHHLPWKEYSRMMFWVRNVLREQDSSLSRAMELEVESKQEMKAAYGQENQPAAAPHSSSKHPVTGSASLLPTSEFSRKVNKAIEAHNAAVQYREAAEAEAQRFFKDARASHASWVAAEREHARSTSIEIDEAIQTGIQMAKDKWIEAMRAARALVKNTQQALACCAEKLKLDMSLEPAESAMRRKQEAALQQLQQLRDETMADLAAGLTAQFLPRCNMSVAEARQLLEKVWHLDDNNSESDTEL